MYLRRAWLLVAVLTALSLTVSLSQEGYCGKAVEIDLSKPDQSAVLEEVSKFTGLSSEVVGLIHEDTAELFEGLDNIVFAGKVVSLITEAKDTEALTEVGMKALEVCKDKLLQQALPAAANVFLTVASVYKTSLELVRDYKWIPGYEEKIYRAYKESRDKDREENIRIAKKSGKKVEDESKYEDTSEEGRSTAFNMGVMTEASGYYVVKGKMLDEMAKEKLNLKSQEEAGEQSLKILNRKVDEFWINRLEMRYQKERMKARKAELIKEIWAKKAQQLEAIKAAASKMAGPERFFLTDKDIPQGWKRQPNVHDKNDFKITFNPSRPEVSATDGVTSQHFDLVNSSFIAGLEEHKYPNGGVYYVYPKDYRAVDVSEIGIDVAIEPRVQQGYGGTVEITADNVRQGGFTTGRQVTGEFFGEGIEVGAVAKKEDKANILYQCVFLKGKWFVNVSAASRSASERATVAQSKHIPDNYVDKTTASGELVRTLAQAVARKIPAGKPEQTEAKKK